MKKSITSKIIAFAAAAAMICQWAPQHSELHI